MNKMQEVKENSLVVISNELTEANYKLTIAEQKFILALISQIDTRKENFETIKVSAKSLSDACGFNPKNGYRQLQQVIKKIFNRSIVIKKRNGTGFQIYNWMQFCDYFSCKDEDNIDCSHIEFELDRRLCPHFLQLKNRFLEIGLNHLISFNHIYSTRFYIIFRNLINNLPQCQKKYSFQDIIQMFQLSATYQKTANLKYVVIKTAIDEINEKSDIEVKYQYYREGGRAHIGVIFTVIKKTDKKEIAPPAPTEQAEPAESKQEHSAGVALLKSIGINPPSASATMANAIEKEEKPALAPAVADAEKVKTETSKSADGGEGTNWTEEQQADYDALIKQEVWVERAKMIINTYDHERIRRNLEGVLKDRTKGTIANPPAVIVSAIKEDSYKGIAEERENARRREQARKKAEWEATQKAEKEAEEQRVANKAKSEKMAKIREQYTAEELNVVMEELKEIYLQNGSNVTDEIKEKLSVYGIETIKFINFIHNMGGFKSKDLRVNKLEKAIKKEIEMPLDFEINESNESIEKIIKAYYANGKKCPIEILAKLNEIGYNGWNDFASKYLAKIMEIGQKSNNTI